MVKPIKNNHTVTERKLGRHKAVGLAYEDGSIEVDPRQSPREYLLTLIHERLHVMFPDWGEKKIAKAERDLGGFLWDNNCRIVNQ